MNQEEKMATNTKEKNEEITSENSKSYEYEIVDDEITFVYKHNSSPENTESAYCEFGIEEEAQETEEKEDEVTEEEKEEEEEEKGEEDEQNKKILKRDIGRELSEIWPKDHKRHERPIISRLYFTKKENKTLLIKN